MPTIATTSLIRSFVFQPRHCSQHIAPIFLLRFLILPQVDLTYLQDNQNLAQNGAHNQVPSEEQGRQPGHHCGQLHGGSSILCSLQFSQMSIRKLFRCDILDQEYHRDNRTCQMLTQPASGSATRVTPMSLSGSSKAKLSRGHFLPVCSFA